MLFSMTGHGEAQRAVEGLSVSVELRTINNRYFKLTLRVTEGYNSLESRVESYTRERIRRGTVYATIRIDRQPSQDDYRLNVTALKSYRGQLAELEGRAESAIPWEALLQLPGVVDETAWSRVDTEHVWPCVEMALDEAINRLNHMRREEGAAMTADLQANCQLISQHLEAIANRAPHVVEAYRGRLTERLNKLLAEYGISIEAADIVREVGIFAERSDISEELVRLRSHLEQFGMILAAEESSGRKLEFLTQEMFREANTIGSKANDAEIAVHVIEIKTAIERVREMIQNVE